MTEADDVYRRQGFGQASGIGAAPALVIVDFVVGFTMADRFGGGNIGSGITQTVELLAFARAQG